MARNERLSTRARRWAIACTVALAVSSVLGATHIHVAHSAHATTLTDACGSDGPFVGRDCPVCALAHIPAIADLEPVTVAPESDGFDGVIEAIAPRSARVRSLLPSRGPPPTS